MAKKQAKKSEPPTDAAIIGEIFRLSQEIVSIQAKAGAEIVAIEMKAREAVDGLSKEVASLREALSPEARQTAARMILGPPAPRAPRQASQPAEGSKGPKLPPRRNAASIDGKTLSAVHKELSSTPILATAVATKTGLDVKTVSKALKALKDEGKAASEGKARGTRWLRA